MVKNSKPKKIDIKKIILEECDRDENIFILSIEKDFAFLMKRKEVVLTETLCAGTMNPVEIQKNKIFFDCFVINWCKNEIDNFSKLTSYGFPIYIAFTEYDARKAIEEA